MKTTLTICTLLIATIAGGFPSSLDDAWVALGDVVPKNTFPTRGRYVRADEPDFGMQIKQIDAIAPTTKGTAAEPIALFYRANALFHLDRFAEALDQFEAIKKSYPNHGLLKPMSHMEPAMLEKAITDCRDELEIRKHYKVQKLVVAELDRTQRAAFHTSEGTFELSMYKNATETVANFKKLVMSGFYNQTYIHEVVALQKFTMGCPNTKNNDRRDDGQGSTGSSLPLELSSATHIRGAVSMLALPNTERVHGAQFNVCVVDQPKLNNRQAVFALVTKGYDVLRRITQQIADDSNNPYNHVVIQGTEWLTGPPSDAPRER